MALGDQALTQVEGEGGLSRASNGDVAAADHFGIGACHPEFGDTGGRGRGNGQCGERGQAQARQDAAVPPESWGWWGISLGEDRAGWGRLLRPLLALPPPLPPSCEARGRPGRGRPARPSRAAAVRSGGGEVAMPLDDAGAARIADRLPRGCVAQQSVPTQRASWATSPTTARGNAGGAQDCYMWSAKFGRCADRLRRRSRGAPGSSGFWPPPGAMRLRPTNTIGARQYTRDRAPPGVARRSRRPRPAAGHRGSGDG